MEYEACGFASCGVVLCFLGCERDSVTSVTVKIEGVVVVLLSSLLYLVYNSVKYIYSYIRHIIHTLLLLYVYTSIIIE